MDALKLEIVPESARETNGYLHSICDTWMGTPVPFLCQPQTMVILIPESLERHIVRKCG